MAKKESGAIMGTWDTMVETYAKMVKSGKLPIEKVPEKFRDAVKAYLGME